MEPVFLFAFDEVENIYSITMKNLLHIFLERGMKLTDMIWIGAGAVVLFFVMVYVGRWVGELKRDKMDPWDDERWL